jgi:hypothetical protein
MARIKKLTADQMIPEPDTSFDEQPPSMEETDDIQAMFQEAQSNTQSP